MSGSQLARIACGPISIAYRRCGDGPPLLMFHGGEGDHQIYDRLQNELAPIATTISFDQRDCGETMWDSSESYTAIDIVEDAVLLVEALGYERVHVLGNSIGGVLAQLLALHRPDKVDRLILGLTWAADESLADLNPEGLALRSEYAARGPRGERDMLDLMAGPGYIDRHPDFLADFRGLARIRPVGDRERRFAALATAIGRDPSGISHRTLVIGASEDRMVPPALCRALADRLPDATFEMVKGAGHLAARQSPGVLADMIGEFLRS